MYLEILVREQGETEQGTAEGHLLAACTPVGGLLFLAFLLVFCLLVPCYAETDIPLGSPLYPVLDNLQRAGYTTGLLGATRPLSYAEARRLLDEAQDNIGSGDRGEVEPYVRRSLDLAEEELALELDDTWFQFKPIARPETSFIYLNGENSTVKGINSSQNSLVYNNDGIDPDEGFNGYLRFSVEGTAGPFTFSLTPLFYLDGAGGGIIQKGYVKFHAMGLDLEAGKIPLWWGQGYHGTLFLSNNAEPLPMVRLTNPGPVLLPWFFHYLGPFRFDVFVSRLEAERVVPRPYFAGFRVEFRPHPIFEIGFTRTMTAFGDGRPTPTFGRVLDALFGSNKPMEKDLSDSIGGIDMRLTLPFGDLYGELGGEDQRGFFPSYPIAYIAGVYLPILDRGLDFRVEFADIRSRSWYTHGVYKSGYTYKGRVLGHHVGRGGRDLFVELGLLRGRRLSGKVNFDYERRGVVSEPVKEKHYQVGTGWEYAFGTGLGILRIGADFAYERIDNFDNQIGERRDDSLVELSISGSI